MVRKEGGRWELTPLGKRMSSWAEENARELSRQLTLQDEIRIGAPREFAARLLAPAVASFRKELGPLRIVTTDSGIESLLLDRKIDFGFDCAAPFSPEIRFKRVCKEELVCVRSDAKRRIAQLPYFHYERFDLSLARERNPELRLEATFSDLGTLRAALLAAPGWSIVPKYTVASELEDGRLKLDEDMALDATFFGLWWRRDRPLEGAREKFLTQWLRQQETSLA